MGLSVRRHPSRSINDSITPSVSSVPFPTNDRAPEAQALYYTYDTRHVIDLWCRRLLTMWVPQSQSQTWKKEP